jgi:hypothetical protein
VNRLDRGLLVVCQPLTSSIHLFASPALMSKRFKLIFLSEHEQYITDVGCTVTVRSGDSVLPDPISRLIRCPDQTARIRIASHSVYLDIEGSVCPRF